MPVVVVEGESVKVGLQLPGGHDPVGTLQRPFHIGPKHPNVVAMRIAADELTLGAVNGFLAAVLLGSTVAVGAVPLYNTGGQPPCC